MPYQTFIKGLHMGFIKGIYLFQLYLPITILFAMKILLFVPRFFTAIILYLIASGKQQILGSYKTDIWVYFIYYLFLFSLVFSNILSKYTNAMVVGTFKIK